MKFAFGCRGLLLIVGLLAMSVSATEITVLSAGAAKAPVISLAKVYQFQTGHIINADYATMGLLQQKIVNGEHADIIIATSEVMQLFENQGKIESSSRIVLGEVGIGVAVNEKAPSPNISTPNALKQTLLKAKSLVYADPSRATSGKYISQMLDRLGIAPALKSKSLLLAGGYVVEPVATGEIEIGLHQISEILPVKGVKLVGPLPSELQRTTVYEAAVMVGSESVDAARALVNYMAAQEGRQIFATRGFTPPYQGEQETLDEKSVETNLPSTTSANQNETHAEQ